MAEHELQRALDRIRREWRLLTCWRVAARALAGAAIVLAAAALASWLLPASPAAELALWSVAALAALAAIGMALQPLRARPTRADVARLVEERCPELEDRVAAAVDSLDTSSPSPFAALLVADAGSRVAALPIARLVDPDIGRRARLSTAAAGAGLLIAMAVALPGLSRSARDLTAWFFPPTMDVRVVPGDVKIPAGTPLTIVAEIRSSDPHARLPVPEILMEGAEKAVMAAEGGPNRFTYTFESVSGGFTYRVAAGTLRSQAYAVQVLTAPRVERIDLHYTFPPFTGLGPRTETNAGDIYAPAGTRVRIDVHTDKPVVDGRLTLAEGAALPLTRRADGVLAGEIQVAQDNAYRVALQDADGLAAPGDTEYFIRTMTDRPPEVRVMRPAGDRQATPLEEVPIEARADDDYGLQSLELVYAVGAGPQRAVPLARPGGATNVEGKATVYLEDLGVQPGDFVSYFARARDIPRGKRASETQSDIFFIEIKSFGSEFQAAQSQAMGGGSAPMGSLAAAQKEILIATWKLQRRAAAGRSASDIKEVARAQVELRGRAMKAAPFADVSRARRMGRAGAPEAPSPLSKAVESMQSAATALEALDLAGAVPHEMEALTQLLKAEAQQQRFQVARNRGGGGGGGSNRVAPDLSALFDRELQRQQETNYETRSSTEERQETAESDALAKVRELAKRQEEINREQRALASQSLTPEELKRRLERLTREQSELRQRAEDLAQQMTREQQAARGADSKGQRDAGAKSGDSQGALRDASQAMGSSASDMRRQNAAGASASGERAAERLRELERQMQREQPGSEQKALGNARLEAQQVAEAQRRIAAESQRTGVDEDARRRVAGEKDRLADRVDALERTLQTLSGRAGGDDRQRLAEAARTLDKEAVARRLREGAAELREQGASGKSASGAEGKPAGASDTRAGADGKPAGGAPQGRMAETDQALARALDQVAERLGGAGQSADTRRMADQLAQAQQARERLAEIERQIDALAKQGEGKPGSGKTADSKGEPSGDPARKGGSPQGKGEAGTSSQSGAQQSAASQQGKDGQSGQGGNASGELARLQQEYQRERQKAEELMRQAQGQAAGMGGTPEQHEFSRSAPGTEAFKQDYARWDSLRKDVNLAIEQLQASLSAKLSEQQARDRVTAGADDRVPEEYRALIAKYYQSLAASGKKP